MNELLYNHDGLFAWQFQDLPDKEDGIILTPEYKRKVENDYNIAIDKKHRASFLTQLEYLTRDDTTIILKIKLNQTPIKSPHYLDDEKSYPSFKKFSYEYLTIKRIDRGKSIKKCNKELILEFDRAGMFELFTRLYVNFEIYATHEDNIILMIDTEKEAETRLVIWGATNGKPIEY